MTANRHSSKWDVFISHASEDKDTFVRPLAVALQSLGVSVWYDEFSLRLGDSLSRSIDHGLAQSSYGPLVISPAFICKPWPEYELRGLVAREIAEDRIILPVWHSVTRSDVLRFSPPLCDKVSLNTAGLTAADVAIQVLREVRPDLYAKHPRAQLEHIASGEALRDLQEEMERTREALQAAGEELSEYRCRFCGAPLDERIGAPADPDEKHWELREIYACGYESFGGFKERPCPSDPDFPKWDEYELQYQHSANEPHFKWQCYALPKTSMARRLSLPMGLGRTKEEAEIFVREHYAKCARRYYV